MINFIELNLLHEKNRGGNLLYSILFEVIENR